MDAFAMKSKEDNEGWLEAEANAKGAEKAGLQKQKGLREETGLQAGRGACRIMPTDTEGTVATSVKLGGKFHGAPVEARMFCINMLGVFVRS